MIVKLQFIFVKLGNIITMENVQLVLLVVNLALDLMDQTARHVCLLIITMEMDALPVMQLVMDAQDQTITSVVVVIMDIIFN